MQWTGGKSHWHGDHPDGLGNGGDRNMEKWAKEFTTLETDLKAQGVELINATIQTRLTVTRRDLRECF